MRAINVKPRRGLRILLGCLPFGLLLLAYVIGSDMRLSASAHDKLLPGLGTMAEAVQQYAFTVDVRTGNYLMW